MHIRTQILFHYKLKSTIIRHEFLIRNRRRSACGHESWTKCKEHGKLEKEGKFHDLIHPFKKQHSMISYKPRRDISIPPLPPPPPRDLKLTVRERIEMSRIVLKLRYLILHSNGVKRLSSEDRIWLITLRRRKRCKKKSFTIAQFFLLLVHGLMYALLLLALLIGFEPNYIKTKGACKITDQLYV